LFWSALFNPGVAWRTSHMIAPIFLGDRALRSTGFGFNAGVVRALALHYGVGSCSASHGWVLHDHRTSTHTSARHRGGRGDGRPALPGQFHFGVVKFLPWLPTASAGRRSGHVVFGSVARPAVLEVNRTATENLGWRSPSR
jgi:hypothetical protein